MPLTRLGVSDIWLIECRLTPQLTLETSFLSQWAEY
jgi:hypothetical protein